MLWYIRVQISECHDKRKRHCFDQFLVTLDFKSLLTYLQDRAHSCPAGALMQMTTMQSALFLSVDGDALIKVQFGVHRTELGPARQARLCTWTNAQNGCTSAR